MSPARLSVAVVTFEPDLDLLERCLRSLAVSVRMARERGLVSAASLFVVDNDEVTPADLPGVAVEAFGDAGRVELIHGHGNVGYGRANNLAIARLESDLHLVMNPDVELEPAALAAAVAALEADPK
ncbi:MAG TPA: glycosyltransferase, partial [Usitatibacter sp.]|nr:glycosyltransferase [Usitatibacter sp.]